MTRNAAATSVRSKYLAFIIEETFHGADAEFAGLAADRYSRTSKVIPAAPKSRVVALSP